MSTRPLRPWLRIGVATSRHGSWSLRPLRCVGPGRCGRSDVWVQAGAAASTLGVGRCGCFDPGRWSVWPPSTPGLWSVRHSDLPVLASRPLRPPAPFPAATSAPRPGRRAVRRAPCPCAVPRWGVRVRSHARALSWNRSPPSRLRPIVCTLPRPCPRLAMSAFPCGAVLSWWRGLWMWAAAVRRLSGYAAASACQLSGYAAASTCQLSGYAAASAFSSPLCGHARLFP
ncbi:hypothetical protein SAMN05444920_105135 [Nonomuraea solani]|uniref:Uncharacterized protein n=1 Tax=Nonomuraea solani TaxID=1144553 RepID=A0A1H6DEU2_9ACTN|nr:hypothetical protein SAMN05444920_105135 [Nonomuraea solani]